MHLDVINHTNFKDKILVSCMSYTMYKIGQVSKLSAFMRLKFDSYAFNMPASLKAVFCHLKKKYDSSFLVERVFTEVAFHRRGISPKWHFTECPYKAPIHRTSFSPKRRVFTDSISSPNGHWYYSFKAIYTAFQNWSQIFSSSSRSWVWDSQIFCNF